MGLVIVPKFALSPQEPEAASASATAVWVAFRRNSFAQAAAALIKPGAVILTHCHSHSVVDALIKAKNKISKVYCCEARPLYQGRMTACDLTKAGIDATLIIDGAASTVMKKCDYFFTGYFGGKCTSVR